MYPPPGKHHLQRAAHALLEGGVIACPTEAVWGLSCDPFDAAAVARLLQLKGRPPSKGLILVAASEVQFDFLLEGLGRRERGALSASWPGPATWLVPHRERLPRWVHGAHDTVALRVSAHPAVAALCHLFGAPLVSTSANPAGARPARCLFQVKRYFGDHLDGVLPGRLGGLERPTPIRDLRSGAALRR